ncbi:MAG: GTP cyclohydrolase I FolE [Bacteroidia bacterium]
MSLTKLNLTIDNDDAGDHHYSTSDETPLRKDAFLMDDELKMELIEKNFSEIMHILGLDLTDDSLSGTPRRVAKMFVKEIFSGLNPANKPDVKLFSNKYAYGEMLVEKDITLFSYCEHHFVPIIGKAHVAYIPKDNVVGLSKLNRIVKYYAKRPQVQERLTVQIANDLRELLGTDDVAVIIDAKHLCVAARGVEDVNSSTVTASYNGRFRSEQTRSELMKYISGI